VPRLERGPTTTTHVQRVRIVKTPWDKFVEWLQEMIMGAILLIVIGLVAVWFAGSSEDNNPAQPAPSMMVVPA